MVWTHDVVVVGAGSAGLTAAGGCARLGLRVALIERDRMGGECLNTGCVPSKALLAAAGRAAAMRDAARFGIAAVEPAVDFAAVMAGVHAAIARVAPHDDAARFRAWGVEVIPGRARLTRDAEVVVQQPIGAPRRLIAPRVVLATGSRPALPALPGLDDVPVLTTDSVWAMTRLPSALIVLGGGAIGVELAQAFRRLGAAVTLVEPGAVLGREDPDAAALVVNRLVAEGVRVLAGQAAVAVSAVADGVRLTLADGTVLPGSDLLVATGRQAVTDELGLADCGVAVGPDGIIADVRGRTSRGGIYAIGDCRAGPRLTHVAGQEGAALVARLGFGWRGRLLPAALPRACYAEPQLAQLGMTEPEARAAGGRVEITLASFADNDRALAGGEAAGFLRLVRRGRRLAGVTIVGAEAAELLLPWSLVINGRASRRALGNTVVAYPTRSEISRAAAFAGAEAAVFGRAARLWARGLAFVRAVAPRRRGGISVR